MCDYPQALQEAFVKALDIEAAIKPTRLTMKIRTVEANVDSRFSKKCNSLLGVWKKKDIYVLNVILIHPNQIGTFYLDTDTKKGAVLSQEEGGLEKVIGYYSKTLHRQKNWYVTRKELYPVVKAYVIFILCCLEEN